MKPILYLCLTLCGPLLAGDARVVPYGERDIVRVNAKIRYTTLLVLPKHERILDFTCGDKEFWIVDGNQNFAYVKPAKEGSATNLNLINAASIISLRNAQDSNKVLVALAEQQVIEAKRQRDAEARAINNHIRFMAQERDLLAGQKANASAAMLSFRMP